MEKKVASIYLDPSQPASFGGLDAVYRAVKEKGKNKISRKPVSYTHLTLPTKRIV